MPKAENTQNDPERINSLISSNVPTCRLNTLSGEVIEIVVEHSWDDMNFVFVLDEENKLVGILNMSALSSSNKSKKAEELMDKVDVVLKSDDKRQKAILLAVRQDRDILPVVDDGEKFMGAVTSKSLINLMHEEHIENFLLSAGVTVRKHQALTVATAGLLDVVKFRLPWLIIGLVVGLGLGLISSGFEDNLKENIVIAYFIPVVAYIADSVGTQSEAIAVRSLATLKVKAFPYLLREFLGGLIIGTLIGVLGGLGAFLISFQVKIGLVVGVSLFVASTIASVLGSAVPLIFKRFNVDPALGSGPLATAVQDILSVLIYFLFVVWLL